MTLTEAQKSFWNSYVNTLSTPPVDPTIEVNVPGNKEIANELLSLILQGKKTASSSLLKDYEFTGDPLPVVGKYWMVLNKDLEPKCIVQTVKVERIKFKNVTKKIALAEGEGDLSLDYWRKVHIDFFTPFLKDWGVKNIDEEELVVEFFKVVYQ
jgi:5-formyltetrahydrofolate cyclo-ligase